MLEWFLIAVVIAAYLIVGWRIGVALQRARDEHSAASCNYRAAVRRAASESCDTSARLAQELTAAFKRRDAALRGLEEFKKNFVDTAQSDLSGLAARTNKLGERE
jgi:predicted negative regulator of RcsB-dependent stress response